MGPGSAPGSGRRSIAEGPRLVLGSTPRSTPDRLETSLSLTPDRPQDSLHFDSRCSPSRPQIDHHTAPRMPPDRPQIEPTQAPHRNRSRVFSSWIPKSLKRAQLIPKQGLVEAGRCLWRWRLARRRPWTPAARQCGHLAGRNPGANPGNVPRVAPDFQEETPNGLPSPRSLVSVGRARLHPPSPRPRW